MALGLVPLYAYVLGVRASAAPAAVETGVAALADAAGTQADAAARAAAPTPTPLPPIATPAPVASSGTPEPIDTAVPTDQRFAFVLLGYGGASHDGGYLTDSIVVVIVDPERKTLTMLSVPRDTWVPMSFDGKSTFYHKINTAYAFAKDPSLYPNRKPEYRGSKGAGTFVSDTLSRVLGVPIKYYLALDFAGFRQAIDAVGGVEVDVPRGFASLYPANDNPLIDPSWTTIRFRSGVQKMNGERAIQYARAREIIDDSGENGDFARSRRQRLIIEAFKSRLFQPGGMLALPKLLTIAAGHVDTNYDVPGAAQIGQLLLGWKDVQMRQTALTLANFLEEGTGPEGMYLLVPSMPDRSWAQVRAFVRRLWNDPATGVAAADTPVTVVNATGVSGLAGRLGESLARLGYHVTAPASGPLRPTSRLIDRTGAGGVGALTRALEKDLGAEVVGAFEPPASSGAKGLVLELGVDGTKLAELAVPRDAAAPSSSIGVKEFGAWVPEPEVVATATPEPVKVVITHPASTATPVAGLPGTGTPRVVRTGTAHAAVTGTPARGATHTAGTRTPGPSAGATLGGRATPTPAPARLVASPTDAERATPVANPKTVATATPKTS